MIKSNEVDGRVSSDSSVLAELIDRLTAKMQAGEEIDWDQVARQHPEHAGELVKFKPALGALGDVSLGAGGPFRPGLASGSRGWFVIGRPGGFPHHQRGRPGRHGDCLRSRAVSLGRRVALKVLPFAATFDATHLQRFHNEAQAAAQLHHTNIVPVYAVGRERGVHFYAMQLIEGQSLAAMIREMRQFQQKEPVTEPREGPTTTAYTPPVAAVTTAPVAALSTTKTGRDAAYFRKVASWREGGGVWITPIRWAWFTATSSRANLMLDHRGRRLDHRLRPGSFAVGGRPDADRRPGGNAAPHEPGAGAGPERVIVDHRTDVYSLVRRCTNC